MDWRLGGLEGVLDGPQVRVPSVEAVDVAVDGVAGRVDARLGAKPPQSSADQPDVQRAGDIRHVPGAVVRAVERGQVPDGPRRAGPALMGTGRGVRSRPRTREMQTVGAAGLGPVLPGPLERVRHAHVDPVRSSIHAVGRGRAAAPVPRLGRRRGPTVLALGRPAATGRRSVRRGHRHGVHAAAVFMPTQLLHRSHASVAGQGA